LATLALIMETEGEVWIHSGLKIFRRISDDDGGTIDVTET